MATNNFNLYEAIVTSDSITTATKYFIGSDSPENALSVLRDFLVAETNLEICSIIDSKSQVIVDDETP